MASGTVRFDRDEVSGPLRSAPGTDGVIDLDDTYEEEIKEQEGAWTHKVKREQHTKVSPSAFRFLVPFQTSLHFCRLELKGCLPVKTKQPLNSGMSLFPPVSQCTSSDRFLYRQMNCTRIIHSDRSHSTIQCRIMSRLLPLWDVKGAFCVRFISVSSLLSFLCKPKQGPCPINKNRNPDKS